MKRPSFQFYPADWRKDTALQSCSLEARGLWHEMLCLMHECDPYGHLAVNGNPMKAAQVARLVGVTQKEYQSLLEELTAAGVPSTGDDGTIFSRRMVRDEHIRNVRAQAGKLGGNPNLLHGKDKQKDNQGGKQNPEGKDNQNTTPSSASSSSASQTNSVPIGTDADASPGMDSHEAMFRIGVPWLVDAGAKEKNVRSMLGGAEKQLGADAAWELMQDCMREKPLEPVAWIAAAINARMPAGKGKGKPSRHSGFDKIDYREGINGDGSF